MKLDRTLLDKKESITKNDLKDYFGLNDYTTAKSDFDMNTATEEQNIVYSRAKVLFEKFWCEQQKKLAAMAH